VQLLRCALYWQIVDNQRLVPAGGLLTSGPPSRTRRVIKAGTINSERIEVLHVRKVSSYYITTNGIFKLGSFIKLSDRPSRNPDFRTIGSANCKGFYTVREAMPWGSAKSYDKQGPTVSKILRQEMP